MRPKRRKLKRRSREGSREGEEGEEGDDRGCVICHNENDMMTHQEWRRVGRGIVLREHTGGREGYRDEQYVSQLVAMSSKSALNCATEWYCSVAIFFQMSDKAIGVETTSR